MTRHIAKTRSDDEKKEIYDKWHALINMSQKELEDWGEDPDHLQASLNREEAKDNGKIQSGYDSFHRIKRRKEKLFKDWTNEDFDNASQENGFNSRMLGNEPGDIIGDTGMSKWEISLRNWGHDPSKPSSPQNSKWKKWQKQHEDEIAEDKKMKKKACIVAAGYLEGDRVLFKTRDRNYQVPVSFHHEVRNGVEVVYFKDEFTGWCEGMNEFGIGIVNSTLTVDIDVSRMAGSSKRDASILLKALEEKTPEKASEVIAKYKGGLYGHTLVSSATETFAIEHFEGKQAVVSLVDVDDFYVRTNHGLEIPDAGYQKDVDPEDRKSSVLRRLRALKTLRETDNKSDLIKNIYEYKPQSYDDPFNMVRHHQGFGELRTSAQYMMDLPQLEFSFYSFPYRHRFQGYYVNVVKPKIKLRLFRCKNIKEGENFQVVEVDLHPENQFLNIIKKASGLNGVEELFDAYLDGNKKEASEKVIKLYKTSSSFRRRLD